MGPNLVPPESMRRIACAGQKSNIFKESEPAHDLLKTAPKKDMRLN